MIVNEFITTFEVESLNFSNVLYIWIEIFLIFFKCIMANNVVYRDKNKLLFGGNNARAISLITCYCFNDISGFVDLKSNKSPVTHDERKQGVANPAFIDGEGDPGLVEQGKILRVLI